MSVCSYPVADADSATVPLREMHQVLVQPNDCASARVCVRLCVSEVLLEGIAPVRDCARLPKVLVQPNDVYIVLFAELCYSQIRRVFAVRN